MNRRFVIAAWALSGMLAMGACSESAPATDGGPVDSAAPDSGAPDSEAPDSSVVDSSVVDSSVVDSGAADTGPTDDSGTPPGTCGPPDGPRRGLAWVRENSMFISGLIPGLAAPDAAGGAEYFDLFGANAVHLWESGLPTRMDAWAALGLPDFRWVSWVKFDGTSHDGGEVIGGYGADPPGRIGYQIGDEPREWADYHRVAAGIAATRAADPNGLHYINFTHYADNIDAFLDHYADNSVGDIISYDVYGAGRRTHERIGHFQQATARSGIPSWCYINFFSRAPDAYDWSETDMRWSVFLHALNGCTGYSWFIYQIDVGHELRPAGFAENGNYAADKRAPYVQAAQINRELAVLGRTLTQLQTTEVRYVASGSRPPGTTAWRPGAGGDPYLTDISVTGSTGDVAVGFFVDDDCETYVMVQNQSHPAGYSPVANDRALEVTLSFDFGGATDPTLDPSALLALDKVTGDIDTVALTASSVTLDLPAGEIFFYKYKTSRPFVRQAL